MFFVKKESILLYLFLSLNITLVLLTAHYNVEHKHYIPIIVILSVIFHNVIITFTVHAVSFVFTADKCIFIFSFM